jgi:hypothetical protein
LDSFYDLSGYSFGLGFRFSRYISLDLAYDSSSQNSEYSFLNIDGVDPAELEIKNDRFTTSLVVNF